MAMTRASRNVGLRARTPSSIGHYSPSDLGSPPYPGSPPGPDPYGRDPVNPSGYEPGGSGPAPYDPLSSIRAPANPAATYEPGDSGLPFDPATTYEPGGGQQVYGAAGYAMPAWSPPTPPPRPAGLGGVLSRAVVPAAAPARAAPAAAVAAAPAAAPQSSMFTGIDRQNSGPNDRFRGGGTALNLSGLLGGLFGGGGAAPSPAPPPPPAAVSGARAGGRVAPDMTGISFDANGNPVSGYELGPGISPQESTQLAGSVSKPGWWKPIR